MRSLGADAYSQLTKNSPRDATELGSSLGQELKSGNFPLRRDSGSSLKWQPASLDKQAFYLAALYLVGLK
jgi:hypothetical protein